MRGSNYERDFALSGAPKGTRVLILGAGLAGMTWKDVQSRIPWGTVIVFGVGISLGTALLTTQAGQWLGATVVAHTGLDQVGPLGVFAILGAFLILIHLGFASATALTSALPWVCLSRPCNLCRFRSKIRAVGHSVDAKSTPSCRSNTRLLLQVESQAALASAAGRRAIKLTSTKLINATPKL